MAGSERERQEDGEREDRLGQRTTPNGDSARD
jgi:hypothetical protein